jgi:RNA polymerase sigma-B factor
MSAYADPSAKHAPPNPKGLMTMRPLAIAWTDSAELFARWQEGTDRGARDELIRRFLPLTRQLARRYAGGHEPFDDLMQVASVGLVKAIDRFDATRGTAFSSFAVPTILCELKRYFRDLGWSVHVPRGLQEQAIRVQRAQYELTPRAGRAPSVQQVAEYLELSIEEVVDALQAARAHHCASLDAPREHADGESATIADTFGQLDGRLELIEMRIALASAVKHLPPRARRVLALRFNDDMTQVQIAKQIGISQMQVSRILRNTLARLSELAYNGSEPPCPGKVAPRGGGEARAATRTSAPALGEIGRVAAQLGQRWCSAGCLGGA